MVPTLIQAIGSEMILFCRQSAYKWLVTNPVVDLRYFQPRIYISSSHRALLAFASTSQWRESWKSASVVNAHLVDDPTIRQPGFALPRQQWSLLNCFRTGQGHCGTCKKKWKLSDSDQCSCGETQTMSHIVESCPQTRLHGGLSKQHSGS